MGWAAGGVVSARNDLWFVFGPAVERPGFRSLRLGEWADNAGQCHHPRCTVVGRQVQVMPPTWCLCGIVDDAGDGTCADCGRRIMTDGDDLDAEYEAEQIECPECSTPTNLPDLCEHTYRLAEIAEQDTLPVEEQA